MEQGEIETILFKNESWPYLLNGKLYITDASVTDTNHATWAIGILKPKGSTEEILVEFTESVLIEAGIDLEFNFPDIVTLSLGKPKDEYYQVEQIR
jgi:hypothetical protein